MDLSVLETAEGIGKIRDIVGSDNVDFVVGYLRENGTAGLESVLEEPVIDAFYS